MNRSLLTCSAAFLSLCLLGCGGGADGAADRVDVHPVSGTVTFANGPVANATVTFSPKDKQPVATAVTDSQGKYTLTTYEASDGAAEGDYVVLVTKIVQAAASDEGTHDADGSGGGGTPSHDAKDAAAAGGGLPEKYSSATASDLNVTVKAGDNKIDLSLNP